MQEGMSALPLIATVKADIALQDDAPLFRNRGVRTMQDDVNLAIPTPKRAPWNKGKLNRNQATAPAEARLGIRTTSELSP